MNPELQSPLGAGAHIPPDINQVAPGERLDAKAAGEKLDALRALLRQLRSVLVCYSGGIDSITAVSPSLAPREREDAGRLAESLGARHYFVDSHEIDRPGYVANGPDRCFHCKSELYQIAREQLVVHEVEHILNGTNRDDLGDYRPGLDAARQAGVRSPLVELGFNKEDVRAVARLLGLPIWQKPAAACLSSRIPYGTSVTRERLAQIAGLEQDLKDLGFTQLRVRWHGKIARIELTLAELPRALEHPVRENMLAAGKRHGFHYVTLDLEGYRMGSHNEVLPGHLLKVI
jgi:uncharacterized protein